MQGMALRPGRNHPELLQEVEKSEEQTRGWFGGNMGSRTLTAHRRRAQGGRAQEKQVTHVPTVAQRWQGMSQHNPSQSGGTPNSTPTQRPSRLGFVHWAGSGEKGHMPKPFPEPNNHRWGNGHAWAPSPGQGPAAAPQLWESTLSAQPRKRLEFTAGAPSPRLHPEAAPRV